MDTGSSIKQSHMDMTGRERVPSVNTRSLSFYSQFHHPATHTIPYSLHRLVSRRTGRKLPREAERERDNIHSLGFKVRRVKGHRVNKGTALRYIQYRPTLHVVYPTYGHLHWRARSEGLFCWLVSHSCRAICCLQYGIAECARKICLCL